MKWSRMGVSKDRDGLGYRDLLAFNLALLAKQGWRLMQNSETLVGRIFQEKYYRGKGFLEANLGTRPSFAWRSIWSAKNLVEDGIIWRVGNGNRIRVWKDRWLPSYHSNKVQAPINLLHEDATVSELINPEINWWNIPVVEQIFPQEVADQICGIAISPRAH
jgi:hypothetical protein